MEIRVSSSKRSTFLLIKRIQWFIILYYVQFKDVKSNRALFPLKMDVCVSSKPKKVPNSECPLKNIKPQENAQKFNNFSQNNNGQSFIPVYTKKTETCHNFNRNPKDDKCPSKRADSPEPTKSLHFGHSPPLRQRVLPDSNEKTPPVKTWSMHMRRRSVGFEDMTSIASRYGYNLTNDQRVKTRSQNCNVESGPNSFAKSNTNLENHKDIATKLKTESENGSIARGNQNIQISSENENNHILKGSKPSQYLKDKSSKRKSSLNRIDFIDYSSCTGNNHLEKTLHQTHSSSDEDDLKSLHSKPDSYSTNSKRKHNRDSASPSLLKAADRKNNEVPPSNSTASKSRCNPLPRSLQRCHLKMRQHKRTHSASHLQKLSHSSPWKKNCENSSHCLNTKPSDQSLKKTDPGDSSVKDPNCCDTIKTTEPVLGCLQLNGLNLKHMDSHSDDEVAQSITRMASLDISQEPCPNPTPGDTEVYLSAEENLDDSDKRRGSILRKTTSEEKRELHGILKPPSEENLRTLPSILKHRESSEEKEMWLQGGNDLLHSILKKSTSEEESCNSGSDGIRPILKLSTDDESPSGNGPPSSRPRPILKKRTSFSEECYYASYPNGELKPILKKKLSASARSSSTDHPRPILKCRRKSEDVKSFSEFVASRPRAYSADAGVVKRSSDDGGIYKEL
ncbi:hypothetical protein JTE90_008903 [Oedothorax gibbosus]|uniref:Uncharacterized protein n=1 Tax=Oedothorax gibbosus TaxID=931172 RepID=A0AAV6UK86_9ARAC|nr:hypothetical protein JTE90_008903 [Oedothorax gibbosus]